MCKKIHQFIKRKNCNHCYLVKILFFIMSLYQNIFIFDKAVSFMFAKWKEIIKYNFFLNDEIFGESLSYIVVVVVKEYAIIYLNMSFFRCFEKIKWKMMKSLVFDVVTLNTWKIFLSYDNHQLNESKDCLMLWGREIT